MRVRLRDYQEKAVRQIRDAYRAGHRSVLLSLPTGGGKTVIFSYVAEAAVAKGNRVVVLEHRQELVAQARATLENLGLSVGLVAPGEPEQPDLPIQVASVQSLVRRLPKWKHKFDLIVIDEAHHAVAGSWRKVLDAYPEAHRLGVTATPERLDGKGLQQFFTHLVEGPGTWELMQRGFLAPCRVFCPPTNTDFRKLRVLAGDYKKDEAAKEMGKPTLIGDVVKHYKSHLHPGTAIAFCVTVDHARLTAEAFTAAGVRASVIDGTLDRKRRQKMIDGLATGEVEVLCSCEIISEGTDVPSVGGALLLRPTMSLALFLQQVGRCLRPAPGKEHAVVLDHAGNVRRHGLPQDIHHWSLEGAKERKAQEEKRRDAAPVRVCQNCFAAIPLEPVCPYCGHEQPIKTKPVGIYGEGELRELKIEEAKIRAREREDQRRRRSQIGKARTLVELKAIAKERGYSPGWAYHIFNARNERGRQL